MINKQIAYTLSILLFLGVFVSCGGGDSDKSGAPEETGLEELMSEEENQTEDVSLDALEDVVQNIPSPIEMSAMLKAKGIEFYADFLNHTTNVNNYTTAYKQAINLGIYGADLGYINIYEKTSSSLNYLNAVKTVADHIKVGQFFDLATLKRLSNNKKNVDSLLYITTSNFNKMDIYLREQGRGNLSILMVAGAWLEGLHISCQVAKRNNNEEIIEKIGEQKIVLDDVLLLLNVYNKDEDMLPYIASFEALKTKFDEITISETIAEPEMKEVDGVLVITDNSTSSVSINQEQLDKIIAATEETRSDFIN